MPGSPVRFDRLSHYYSLLNLATGLVTPAFISPLLSVLTPPLSFLSAPS